MIAWLEGDLRYREPGVAILDVRGVGYELSISLATFSRLPETGKTVSLHVRTVVREDAIQLFGFATAAERAAFDLLLKASRVGPKLAQAILSGIEPERLLLALRDGDLQVLRGAPGVGPKLAERMGVELRDRAADVLALSGCEPGAGGAAAATSADVAGQLLSALLNLGYPRNQAAEVVSAAEAECSVDAPVEDLIRVALRMLAR